MINSLGEIVLNFAITIINIILIPIDSLLSNYLPVVNNFFNYITDMFNLLFRFSAYIIDSLCLPPFIISAIIDYLVFKLTFPYVVYFIKLAIKWYNNLKL